MARPNPFARDPFDFDALFNPNANRRASAFDFKKQGADPYSLLQLIEQRELARKGQRGGSFLDKVKSGGGDVLMDVLNVISRPGWAVAEGARRGLEGEGFDAGDFLKGASRGIQGKAHTGFGQVLEQEGFLKGHRRLRGVAGLVGDIATDPLNLLLLAAAPVTGGGSLALMAGKEGAEQGIKRLAVKAAQKTQGSGAFASLDDADDVLKTLRAAGDEFQANAVLAQTKRELLAGEKLQDPFSGFKIQEEVLDVRKRPELAAQQAVAHVELEKALGPKYVQARLKIPFVRASGEYGALEGRVGRLNRGAVNLTPAKGLKAPSLLRLAEGGSKLNKIPFAGGGLASGADWLGKTFKPGFGNEEYHAAEMAAKRSGEFLHRVYRRENEETLGRFMAGGADELTPEGQIDALDWAEGRKDLLDSGRKMQASVLRAGVQAAEITPRQAKFLHSWHKTTERLRERDVQFFGQKPYDKEIRGLYVPHLYTKKGEDLTDPDVKNRIATALSKKGFQYSRHGETTIKALREAAASDHLKKVVETDPITLLATRTRRGAQSHADRLLATTVGKTMGKPTRLPDKERLAKLREERKRVEEGQQIVDKNGRVRRIKGVRDLNLLDPRELDRLSKAADDGAELRRDEKLATARQERDDRLAALNQERKKLVGLGKGQATRLSKRWPKTVGELERLTESELKAQIKDPAALRAARKSRKLMRVASDHRSRLATIRALRKKMDALQPDKGKRAHGSKYRALLVQAIKTLEPEVKFTYRTHGDSGKVHRIRILAPLSHKESWVQRLDGYLDSHLKGTQEDLAATREAAQATWDAARIAQKHVPKRAKPYDRKVAEVDKKIAAEYEGFANKALKSLDDLQVDKTKSANKLHDEMAKEFELAQKLAKRLQKIDRQTQRALTALHNPDVPKDWLEVKNLKMPGPGGKDVTISVEPKIRAAMLRQRRIITDDEALRQFDNAWHRGVAKWKVAATVVNLGYAMRNTMSDYWNMYLAGVPAWAMTYYSGRAARVMFLSEKALRNPSKIGVPERKALSTFIEAYHHGILSGLYEGDIQEISRFLRSGQKGRARDFAKNGQFVAAYTRAMGDFNRHRENWGRMSHYLYRRDHEKMTPAASAIEVKTAHFDYEDLTPFEQGIKRNFIPFYTWTRKNIPYQVKQLASRPGRYAAFTKAMNESEYASGDSKGDVMPDYLKNAMAFKVPFGDNSYFIPQIGAADLQRLQHPTQLLGMMNPALKIPLELAANKSFHTQAPIFGGTHPRNPVSEAAAPFLNMIPGANVGRTERTVRGQQEAGTGAHPLVSYAAGQVPLTNFLINQMSSIRRKQRGEAGGVPMGALAYLGGLSMSDVDPDQALNIASLEWDDEMQKLIRGMRDEDILEEGDKSLSPYERMLLAQLQQRLGRPGAK
jgi:hypothetical protein